MTVCFLDLDGVLTDFVGASLAHHGKQLRMKDVRWDFPSQIGFSGTWASEFWDPLGHDFWADLPWTGEGKSLLLGLEDLFKDNILILSSPCKTVGGVEGKVKWIKDNLPDYSRKFFIGPQKHLLASPQHILIDDHDGNTDKFDAHGGRSVLVPRPWNRRQSGTDEHGRFNVGRFLKEVEGLVHGA